MSLRLTNKDRQDVSSRALDFAFAKTERDLAARECVLAEQCYASIFSADIRKLASKLPRGWLREDGCLRVIFPGGLQTVLSLLTPLRVPSASHNCEPIGAVADETLAAEWHALVEAKKDFKSRKKSTSASLSELLSRSFTLKQLREGWPEGAPFYEHLSERATSQLPALQVSTLNVALGIESQS